MVNKEQPKDYPAFEYPIDTARRLRKDCVNRINQNKRFIRVSAGELLDVLTGYLNISEKGK